VHFPLPKPVLQLLHTLQEAGHEAFLVGGCVRDLLRGKSPEDYDVATRALPAEVGACFPRVIPTGIQHGTVTVLLGGMSFEVTTYRREGDYVDGRRPSTVHFHASIEEDLSRRDFTINAMAYSPLEERWVDPWGGRADLHQGLVRCVGNPLQRFSEDGLRAIRAIRFATTLDFALDAATQEAIPQRLELFAKVALERVREEFVKLLSSAHARRGLGLLLDTGLLQSFLPEATSADFAAATRPHGLLPRLAFLLSGAAQPRAVLQRLKFSNKQMETVLHLLRVQPPPPISAGDADLRRWLSKAKEEHWEEALALGEALEGRAGLTPGEAYEGREEGLDGRLRALLAQAPILRVDKLALRGEEVGLILNTLPGPRVGEALRFLLEQVLENPSLNNRETLSRLLQTWNQ
jgi:tRNA nucleotidyltransferase (CCA-adding enzyme)